MWRRTTWIVLGLVWVAPANVLGMFAWYETRQVPIERVFTNLASRLATDTNSLDLTYQLARVHALAYSTNFLSLAVRTNDEAIEFASPGSDTGLPPQVMLRASAEAQQAALRHLTNAIDLYERALVLLRASTNLDQQRWLILPTQLGLAWCLDQAGRREDALAHYRKTLQAAWRMEVTGDFRVREWLNDVWEDVRAGRNPVHARRGGSLGPGVCFSEETIDYLLKCLDPVKDAGEIATLQDKRKTLQGMSRAITPILVPLEPRMAFADLVDPDAQVLFDLDGSGRRRPWGWITPKAAWLVYDAAGNGRITSALQMFGNVTFWIFWHDGYDALASLDDNHDGLISGSELRGLALWHDRNGNGISEPGEVQPLGAFGIIALRYCHVDEGDDLLRNPLGVVFADGETRASYDWSVPGPACEP